MLDADLHKSAKCRGKDAHCNIIPNPAKVKRIRAWMFHPVNITNGSTTGKVTDVTTQDMTGFRDWKSCTILISAKYLAKDKGGRK